MADLDELHEDVRDIRNMLVTHLSQGHPNKVSWGALVPILIGLSALLVGLS